MRGSKQDKIEVQAAPSPVTGLLFLLGGLGSLFGLISVIDPLL